MWIGDSSGVTLQIWWQDQWWNLVTGTQLIRKKYDKQTHVLTWPLITDSSWKKFGKSEGNALFLDKSKTSPYEIYQYFMNVWDKDISKYLKMLTLIETEEIDIKVAKHMENPGDREGQKLLAYSIVEIIHSKKEADLALEISDFMFWSWDKLEVLKKLNDDELKTFQNAMWWLNYMWENLFEIIVCSGLSKSNSEARQAIQSWAISINEIKISDFQYDFSSSFINNKVLLLKKWKKNFRLIVK